MWYWLPVVANIWVTTSHQPGCQLVCDLCKSSCAPGSLCYKYLQWYTLTLLISCGRCLQPICFLRLSRRQMLTFQSLTTQLWIDKRTILWMWVAVGTVFAPEPRYQPLWTDHGSVCYFCFVRQVAFTIKLSKETDAHIWLVTTLLLWCYFIEQNSLCPEQWIHLSRHPIYY